MSQVFAMDSQTLGADVTLAIAAETVGPMTNPVRVPYQNGKIIVHGSLGVQYGTGTNGVFVRVRRNPAAENVIIPAAGILSAAVAGQFAILAFDVTDQVPDGRDCIYEVTVQQSAGTGTGLIKAGSTITAMVISG